MRQYSQQCLFFYLKVNGWNEFKIILSNNKNDFKLGETKQDFMGLLNALVVPYETINISLIIFFDE